MGCTYTLKTKTRGLREKKDSVPCIGERQLYHPPNTFFHQIIIKIEKQLIQVGVRIMQMKLPFTVKHFLPATKEGFIKFKLFKNNYRFIFKNLKNTLFNYLNVYTSYIQTKHKRLALWRPLDILVIC